MESPIEDLTPERLRSLAKLTDLLAEASRKVDDPAWCYKFARLSGDGEAQDDLRRWADALEEAASEDKPSGPGLYHKKPVVVKAYEACGEELP